MHLIHSHEELRLAPELREPNAELLHAHPAHCAVKLMRELPDGTVVAEIRYLDYLNHRHDHCTALLLVTSEGATHLVLNELGTDPLREMHKAGRALAKFMDAEFLIGAPNARSGKKLNFLLRAMGYAG